jgi:hypothetical protein
VDRALRLRSLSSLVDDVDLSRADAIVLIAGMNDAVCLTPLADWRRAMADLLGRFRTEAGQAAVVVVGPQPVRSVSTYSGWPGAIAERHRRAINRVTAELCAARGVPFAIMPTARHTPIVPGHRSPTVYREWAQWIAKDLAPLLRGPEPQPEQPQPEPERQRATEAMLPDAAPDAHLDRITDLARHVFGVECAVVSLIDGDFQKNRSVAGCDFTRLPRTSSLCARTIKRDGALVIADLLEDDQIADDVALPDGTRVRFYAGYPIESPDGYRVGALSVFSSEPRDAAEVDRETLADLALLAQKQLWASVKQLSS